MTTIVRSALVVAGVVAVVLGLGLIVTDRQAVVAGLWFFVVGAVLLLVPIVERNRYRSAAAEHSGDAPGPGGGEGPGGPVEARFQATSERFVDPTTGIQMMVLVDPRTGERRYVAES
jgi:hypothetical protein